MNDLIKNSLNKLKQKNIYNPELDLRILLKHSSKKNNEIILSNFKLDDINIVKFKSLLQKRVNIYKKDSPDSLAKKILAQEHKLYPKAILKIFSL